MLAEGLRRRTLAIRWAALALLLPLGSEAGTISLWSNHDCRTEARSLRCAVEIENRGDRPAVELTVEVSVDSESGDRSVMSDPFSLAPSGDREFDLSLELGPEGAPGIEHRAMIVTTRYRDSEGYPFSNVSVARFGGPVPSADAVELSAGDIVLERSSDEMVVRVANRGADPFRGTLRWVLPEELRSSPERVALRLEPGATDELSFRLENGGALPGSDYASYLLVEQGVVGGGPASGRVLAVEPAAVHVSVPAGMTERYPVAVALLSFALALVGAVSHLRSRGRSRGGPGRASSARWGYGAIVVAATAFVLGHLRPELLGLSTIAAGGDMASHYPTLDYLAGTLLPEGRLLGWNPGNLGGFPIFQLYFPLPFLAMIPIAWFVPLPVAFKWGTVLGALLLPATAFAGLRAFGFRQPIPALGAVSVLPFLFHEANSVWGGNLLSTLAGEFTYSFALALVVIFAGVAYRALRTGRGLLLAACLLGAIGLSHAYALLFAALWFTLAALWMPDLGRALLRVALVGGTAFCLIGFWIVPMLVYSPYTSPYADLWRIDGWSQVVPAPLWPAALTCLLIGSGWALLARRQGAGGLRIERKLGALASGWVAAALLFVVAQKIGVVDIRFLPFAQVWLGLVASVALGRCFERRLPELAAVCATALLLVAAACGLDRATDKLPSWVQWNYAGFESRPGWEDFRAVNEKVRGGASDPRVVFEHAPEHNATGSIRAFESLPFFSGRSTLEGLYIQSSLLTPEIFYAQSAYSSVASCPLPDFHCTAVDLDRAADHLRFFNVSQLIARTDEIKSRLRASPHFRSEGVSGVYEVFRVLGGEERYVVPLSGEPRRVDPEDWRRTAFRWFARGDGRWPMLAATANGRPIADRAGALEDFLATEPAAAAPSPRVGVAEELSSHSIRFETAAPGVPHLVKVAYHPRWRSTTGEAIHLAAPGLMLVTPEQRSIELVFGETAWTLFGKALTGLGLLCVAFGIWRARERSVERPGPSETDRADLASPLAPLAVGACLVAALALRPLTEGEFAPHRFDAGMERYREEAFEEARAEYARAVETSSLSSAAVSSRFYSALTHYREEQWESAIDAFERSIDEFPDSKYRAESEYHIAICLERSGRPGEALDLYRTVAARFPQSPWGDRASVASRRLSHDIT